MCDVPNVANYAVIDINAGENTNICCSTANRFVFDSVNAKLIVTCRGEDNRSPTCL